MPKAENGQLQEERQRQNTEFRTSVHEQMQEHEQAPLQQEQHEQNTLKELEQAKDAEVVELESRLTEMQNYMDSEEREAYTASRPVMAFAMREKLSELKSKVGQMTKASELKKVREAVDTLTSSYQKMQENVNAENSGDLQTIRTNLNGLLETLQAERRITASSLYKAVCKAASKYEKSGNKEDLQNLIQQARIYVDERTNHGTKTSYKLGEKGRNRSILMEQILGTSTAMLHAMENKGQEDQRLLENAQKLVEHFEEKRKENSAEYKELKSQVDMGEVVQDDSRIYTLLQRYKKDANGNPLTEEDARIHESNRRFVEGVYGKDEELTLQVMKEMCEKVASLQITEEMLDPEYILAHEQEMLDMANTSNLIENVRKVRPAIFAKLPEALKKVEFDELWAAFTQYINNIVYASRGISAASKSVNSIEEVRQQMQSAKNLSAMYVGELQRMLNERKDQNAQ